MNFKKLLTLSAAALMVGTTAVGCGSAEKETLTDAAEYLWQMYKSTDESKITASFDVVNKVLVGDQVVTVTWDIEVDGSEAAFSIVPKNENFSTVKVGYYDLLVTEESSVKLIPTFSIGRQSLTLADVYKDEAAKHAIDFTTPVLTLHNHTDWDKNDGALLNIKGIVVDVIATGSSAGSIYMVDAEGNGYYVYNPTSKGAKVGDEIIVTGTRSDYSGQEEFAKGGSYHVTTSGKESTIAFVNATADWAAASSNKSTGDLGAKYQNVPVKLENCMPTRISGSYYYFKVGNGSTEYNVYKNTYFLTDEQTAAWVKTFEEALDNGYRVSIEGISTVYSSAYQIYPCSIKAGAVTKESELTSEEKHAIVKDTLLGAVKESYDEEATYAPTLPKYATVTYEVTAPTANASASVADGKVKITPIKADVENTVVAHVKIGEVTKDVTLKFVTEDASVAKFKTGEIKFATLKDKETVKVKATYAKGGDVEVSVLAKGVTESSGDTKYTPGNSILITAPEGYKIAKVEVDSSGKHNSLDFYSSADKAAGTQFDDNTYADKDDPYSNQYRTENGGRTLTTIPVNGDTLLITNDTESYNVYSKWIKVTLSIPLEDLDTEKVALSPANLLGEGEVSYAAGEKAVGDYTIGYNEIGSYGNGIQMRIKEGRTGSIWNKTAVDTGIKSLKLTHSATKNTYDTEKWMKVEFANTADFANAEVIYLNGVKDQKDYEVTPSVATYKYVRFSSEATFTSYWSSIIIDY